MPASQNFVDLRTSSLSAGSHTDDSVWPSFTDIMTVVVMIFLMSLVVILLRNVELVKMEQESTRLAELKGVENTQLEQAVTALEERITQVQLQLQAQTLKTELSEENLTKSQQQVDSLMVDIQALQLLHDKLNDDNTQLAATKLALEGRLKIVEKDKTDIEALKQNLEQTNLVIEDENQQLIIQLKAAMDEGEQLESTLQQQQSHIESLEKEKQSVVIQVQKLDEETSALSEQAQQSTREFDALQAVYSILQKDNRSLLDRIKDAESMINELEQNLSIADKTIEKKQQQIEVANIQVENKSLALTQSNQDLTQTTQELEQTQTKFTELEKKYLDLVGPARSELNKFVVRVRYERVGNQNVISYSLPGNQPRPITSTELHRRLSQFKQEKGNDLYVRVVIPSNSGLSYDQAWRFTEDILHKYDYYYQ